MIKGKVAHDKLHKENKVKREVIKEAKKIYKDKVSEIKSKTIPTYAKKKLIRSLEKPPDDNIRREFSVVGGRLRGRIDEIIFNDNSVMIIDDKPHDKAYDTDKIQVWGYCYAYMQQFNKELNGRKLIASVRNWKTKDIVWNREYTKENEKAVLSSIKRIDGILDGSIKPIPTTDIRKCMNCNMRKKCDKKPRDAWGGLLV